MGDFVFKVNGLTAQDRAQWEKDNIELLNSGKYSIYNKLNEEDKQKLFNKMAFKNKFGNRPDYNDLLSMPQERKDSLYLASPTDDIEDLNAYQDRKDIATQNYTSSMSNQGNLIGEAGRKWKEFDKMLTEISPYYQRYKGTEYFPLDNEQRKVDLMSTFDADVEIYGKETALRKMARRIQDEVSENQPIMDKLYRGIQGMGAQIVGGTISFVGNIAGGLEAITGADRLVGENAKEGYFENIWSQIIDNPWTRYGDQVIKQNTLFTEEDQDKIFNQAEIIRTSKEQENLLSNIFSVNTVPELMQQSGFTIASMMEGYGLAAVGNKLFNTAKTVTMAKKAGATIETMEALNKTLANINKWQRRYNAYAVPAMIGQGEGAYNALNTKLNYLEDSQKMLQEKHGKMIEQEVESRLQSLEIPKDIALSGQSESFKEQTRQLITDQVIKEHEKDYQQDLDRIERNADLAALNNYVFNSFINGAANITLKAPMFGGKVVEALERTKVGKLFNPDKYRVNKDLVVEANEITKGRMFWNAAKETTGEMGEEYLQDVSDAFSIGAAENDLSDYLKQKYEGQAEKGLIEQMADNLGAAFAAAGKSAVSKDAIQSGIYGALGQGMGTVNINSILSGQAFKAENYKDKAWYEKVNNIYRIPALESYLNDKQENQDRKESAKALNEWLNQGNNKERLTSLKGSLNWAAEMEKGAKNGDEFKFRNSRLGKMIQDYYMLEQLKGSELYDTYIQRYLDIINAKEGDTLAKEIAKYDQRPLEEIQKDAQNMLDLMEKVQDATLDLEKTLGNSIPQEVKESLIFGKLSIEDWNDRSQKLENEIKNLYEGGVSSGLTKEQQEYIVDKGTSKYVDKNKKELEETKQKIDSLEKNEKILSKKKREELKELKKKYAKIQKESTELREAYNKLFGESEEDKILTASDIYNLSPSDRYIILNPKNLNKYSEEQQNIIKKIIDEATLKTSDFMNKIEDAARVYNARKNFMLQYNEALKNPDILDSINKRLQFYNMMEDLEESYKNLGKIEDYSKFAEAVDNALFKGNNFERAILSKTLKDNPLFQKYLDDEEKLSGVVEQLYKNSAFKDLDNKDKELVAAITKFLTRKGIDITDYNKAIEALTSTDENGQSNLTKYIEAINQQLGKDNAINLDNITQIVTNYKKALESYKKNEKVKEEVDKKPEEKTVNPSPTPTAQSSSSNIFKDASTVNTIEESAEAIKREREIDKGATEVTLQAKKEEGESQEQTSQQDVVSGLEGEKESLLLLSDDFINNNTENVVKAAENLIKSVNSNNTIESEDKQKIVDIINDTIQNKQFDSIADFIQSIDELAVNIENSNRDSEFKMKTWSALSTASSKLKSTISKEELNKTEEKQKQEEQKQEVAQEANRMSLVIFTGNTTNFITNKFKEWKVEEFIRDGNIIRGKNKSVVVYVTLNDITEGVKQEMGNKYEEENDLPIIALVESTEGSISIGTTRYQPIGLLPSSKNNTGAKKIREIAINQKKEGKEGRLLSSSNTQLQSTAIVSSPKIEISQQKEDDINILNLIDKEIKDNNKDNNDLTINSIIDRFIDKLFVRKDKNNNTVLYYGQPKMKGSKEISLIPVLINSIKDTTNKDGKTFSEVASSNDTSKIIHYNPITQGFYNTLNYVFNKEGLKNVIYNEETGKFEGLEFLNHIDYHLKKIFYSSYGDFSIKPVTVENTDGTTLGLDLYFGDERLGTLTNDVRTTGISEANVANILKNLIFPNGKYRQGLNWQIIKNEEEVNNKTEDWKHHIRRLVYSNAIRLGIKSLEREINDLTVDVPKIVRDSQPAKPTTTTINPDNASSVNSKPIDTATTPSRQQVDTNIGLTTKGNEVKNNVEQDMNEAQKKAAEIVKKIEKDSEEMELVETIDDQRKEISYYVNKTTNKPFARVTKTIEADKEAGEPFDHDSPWVLPSTNIGTGIDEFIRLFFEGKIYTAKTGMWRYKRSGKGSTSEEDSILSEDITDLDVFPNASINQLIRFAESLQALKNGLDAKGLTVISRDIVAKGKVIITNEQGEQEELDVAGTLDLLAYDANGNFHIYDMKTHHGIIYEDKIKKWRRQLTLYKKFLEETYGIKVASINIIPIKVEYPNPDRRNKYTVGEGNQIYLNGIKYEGAEPKLESIIDNLKEIELNIRHEKLADEYKNNKDMIRKINKEEQKEEKLQEKKQESEHTQTPNVIIGTGRVRRKPKASKDSNTKKTSRLKSGILFSDLSKEEQDAFANKYKHDLTDQTIEDYFNSMGESLRNHEKKCLQ